MGTEATLLETGGLLAEAARSLTDHLLAGDLGDGFDTCRSGVRSRWGRLLAR
ncbi:hypothetical protein [Rhodococcus koreensis]|uniref:hypothetical protein n=1 Tax=Rhodococcus koreensis TaxID=99653 RepID=UPI000AD62498|nr:hypothetical protein [Rhodococcus koreensis]